ncbi:MAG: DUF1579 domain-containing protein [Phycisphaerales bacterium]
MRTGFVVGTVLVAFAAGIAVGAQQSKDAPKGGGAGAKPAQAAPPAGEMPPGMKEMMESAAPGPEHKELAKKIGTWKVTTRMFMDPSKPPEESVGTSVVRGMHDGRYIFEEVKSTFMGMPFGGTAISGFNNGPKEYEYAWIDTMGTGIMTGTGKAQPDGVIVWTSRMWDPAQKGWVTSRSTEKWTGPDSFVSEMFSKGPDGKEMKMMELVYERQTAKK